MGLFKKDYKIKAIDGSVLFEAKVKGIKECVERAVKEGVSLKFANLEGANLSGANLRSADFRQANLMSVVFDGSSLNSANFEGADLTCMNRDVHSASFKGANIERANFKGAKLSLVNFEDAQRGGTVFTDADFRPRGANAIKEKAEAKKREVEIKKISDAIDKKTAEAKKADEAEDLEMSLSAIPKEEEFIKIKAMIEATKINNKNR